MLDVVLEEARVLLELLPEECFFDAVDVFDDGDVVAVEELGEEGVADGAALLLVDVESLLDVLNMNRRSVPLSIMSWSSFFMRMSLVVSMRCLPLSSSFSLTN